MEPIHEGDTDLLLVFCPGTFQTSENYFPLMHTIQSQLKLRLWIVVLHNTDQDVLSTSKVDASLTGVLALLKERGYRPGSNEIENIFVAGHRCVFVEIPHALRVTSLHVIRCKPIRFNLAISVSVPMVMSGISGNVQLWGMGIEGSGRETSTSVYSDRMLLRFRK